MEENPIGLDGIEFIEYSGADPTLFTKLFANLGMVKIATHKEDKISLYRQNDVNFLLNEEPGNFAQEFTTEHGPCVCSTGFRVKDAQKAFETALSRGAKAYEETDKKSYSWPAIYGIGNSIVYFVDRYGAAGSMYDESFDYIVEDKNPKGHGFLLIDHMTNNVPKGDLDKWAKFYEDVF